VQLRREAASAVVQDDLHSSEYMTSRPGLLR
jgi:hypothetical protein